MIPVWFPLQSAIFYDDSSGKISIVPCYDMNETIQKDYVLYGDGNFRNVEFDLISQKKKELKKFIEAQVCLFGVRPSYTSYINFANNFEKMYGYPKESDNITNTFYLIDRVSDSDARSCYSQMFEKNKKAIAPMYDVCNDRITSDVQFIPPTYQIPFVFKFMFNSTDGGFIPVIYYDDDKKTWTRLGRSYKSIDVGVIRPRSLLAKFGFVGLSQTAYQGQSCQH